MFADTVERSDDDEGRDPIGGKLRETWQPGAFIPYRALYKVSVPALRAPESSA